MSWDLRVLASQNFLVETVHISCLEWWHQAAHLVHDASKRPNVWFQAIWFLSPNLGSSVVRCTSLGVEHSFLGYLRDVEVTKLCLPIREQENIGRLHVTVQDLLRVQHLKSFQNLNENFPHEFFFQIYFWGLWVHNFLVNIWFISQLHNHTKNSEGYKKWLFTIRLMMVHPKMHLGMSTQRAIKYLPKSWFHLRQSPSLSATRFWFWLISLHSAVSP